MDKRTQLRGAIASRILLRLALAASFLSAVADRFGFWGAPGSTGVAWGDFASFEGYTGILAWYLPAVMIPAAAWTATALEVILGLFLIVGFQLRKTAVASGCLLTLFFVSMLFSVGIKPPLDYSVMTAAAASFLLAFTLDH